MTNFRKFIIPGTIALTIIGSTTAFAIGSITSTDKTTESRPQMSMKLRGDRGGKFGFENREDKETLMLERQEAEAGILESVESLIPGATAEFGSLKAELETARDAMHEEMDTLKEKIESGEITREEMKESFGDKMGKRGRGPKGFNADETKTERPANHWDELETAIEANDADAAQTAFDSIIEHMTEKLAEMNEMVSDLQ